MKGKVEVKYSLDDLMRVSGESEVLIRGQKKSFWFRTLSHTEADARQNYASAQARAMLRKLREDGSPESKLYLGELAEIDRAELEDALVTLYTQLVLSKEAQKEILPLDEPEPPDDPTIVDVIEAEEANEKIEKDVAQERQTWLEEAAQSYRASLKERPLADLIADARKYRAEQITNAEYAQAYQDAILYYGVWQDKNFRKRLFISPEQTRECDGNFRLQLLAAYYNVDAFSFNGEELKK